MSFPLLFDLMIPRALAEALKHDGYDVLLASDLESELVEDDEALLAYATQTRRVLFTCNYADPRHNFIEIDERWRNEGREHAGIILCPKRRIDHQRLLAMLDSYTSEDLWNVLMWLP